MIEGVTPFLACRKGDAGSLSELTTYREWAERRMSHMISCLQDSERARRDELQRVQNAASQLIKVPLAV